MKGCALIRWVREQSPIGEAYRTHRYPAANSMHLWARLTVLCVYVLPSSGSFLPPHCSALVTKTARRGRRRVGKPTSSGWPRDRAMGHGQNRGANTARSACIGPSRSALACVMMRPRPGTTVVAVVVSIIFDIVIAIDVLKTQALQHTYTVMLAHFKKTERGPCGTVS